MQFKTLPPLLILFAAGCAHHSHHARTHQGDDDASIAPQPLDNDRPLARRDALAVRPGHPRLMIGTPIPENATTTRWQAFLVNRGHELASKPVIEYSHTALLTRSREAVLRLTLYGGLNQITNDPQWAAAARRELINVCTFPDWQPDDFLATAEMMNAVALAYDWAYDGLSPADRKLVQDALITKGIAPALTAYASKGGWTVARHNWNLVCNGGVIVACLAIAEERPTPTLRCLRAALQSISNGLSAFDSAGGTAEGPMYHNYAIKYLTYAAAALSTAPVSPVSLAQEDGNWTKAGDYRVAMTGPSGKSANFGDGVDVIGNSNWMFWHAREFHRPDYAAFEVAADDKNPSIFDYLWYTPPGRGPAMPLVKKFDSAVVLRSPLVGPDMTNGASEATPLYRPQTFVAVRCGSTAGNHSHLDLGTFVLDMLGERFASDLGADNYDLPGYLGNRRGEYLRSSTPGHNTLSIAGASQPLDATATAQLVPASGGRSLVRIDLSNAYPGASKIIREIGVDPSGAVGVTDYIKLIYPGPIIWNLHTAARVTLDKHGALLELNGKRVQMRVLEPNDARLDAKPDHTEPPALPVEGMTHIRVTTADGRETEFKVEFTAVR